MYSGMTVRLSWNGLYVLSKTLGNEILRIRKPNTNCLASYFTEVCVNCMVPGTLVMVECLCKESGLVGVLAQTATLHKN